MDLHRPPFCEYITKPESPPNAESSWHGVPHTSAIASCG
jgi:hypothetical protein